MLAEKVSNHAAFRLSQAALNSKKQEDYDHAVYEFEEQAWQYFEIAKQK